MDLRFTTPDLAALDQIGTEVLVAGLAVGERPPHGVAGLVDWRMAGHLSRLVMRGFATGKLGEVLLIPGRPKLPYEKVILFGVGRKEEFEEGIFRSVAERILQTLAELKARTAVVELPGRHFDAIAPERAADILLECAGAAREQDVWTLIERAEAQKLILRHMVQERRRLRRE